jgi:signal transduction histidine kinase
MSAGRRPLTATLFARVLALIVLSLTAAVAVNALVVFNLPPPTPDFYQVRELVEALRGPPPAVGHGRTPLVVSVRDRPPAAEPLPPLPVRQIRSELASLLKVDETDVVVATGFSRFADRQAFRLVRAQAIKKGISVSEPVLIAPFRVALRQADGRWRVVQPAPSLTPTPWQRLMILWLALSTLAVTPIAYWFARRLAAPLAQFADSAERLGRDPHDPPLAIKGPVEIDVAVRAFNHMQERLSRYVEDRTAMIGAIAHDLRTPLTRLRFRLEAAPEELKERMSYDIAEMEAMISGTLAFVRDATRPAARTRLELASLVESLADEMSETGADVEVETAERAVVEGDVVALRRLLNNLLENAVKFGGAARVRVIAQAPFAIVEIDDPGPGLPPEELERVFEPFYRRETSRSRDTGGIGLGLAVVRSLATAHGGDAVLENRLGGGLTARVRLPL